MTGEFPEGFIWGISASGYQIEGTHLTDGRGQRDTADLKAFRKKTDDDPGNINR